MTPEELYTKAHVVIITLERVSDASVQQLRILSLVYRKFEDFGSRLMMSLF